MADKKPETETEHTEDAGQVDRVDVLTNAMRRLDNRFRGRPNDPSLIGEDMPEEDEDSAEDDDLDGEDPAEQDDEWPEPKGTKLW